jgi:hypothetical protein
MDNLLFDNNRIQRYKSLLCNFNRLQDVESSESTLEFGFMLFSTTGMIAPAFRSSMRLPFSNVSLFEFYLFLCFYPLSERFLP